MLLKIILLGAQARSVSDSYFLLKYFVLFSLLLCHSLHKGTPAAQTLNISVKPFGELVRKTARQPIGAVTRSLTFWVIQYLQNCARYNHKFFCSSARISEIKCIWPCPFSPTFISHFEKTWKPPCLRPFIRIGPNLVDTIYKDRQS